MLKRELTEKIQEMLLRSCRSYFEQNISGKTYPEELDITLQITRDPAHGDLSSNIAMRLARSAGRSPVEIAESVVPVLRTMMDEQGFTSIIGTVEVKGGFINFRLSEECFEGILRSILEEGDDYGRSFTGKGEKVNLEFVSANPTGPLTIAHGRQAAIGDALSRILRFNG
ncbi:MAG: arginine--tRNA ligase, partial [Candidatus Omnitrophica bacterium]|nr:arginine--tRNA ligase [Candidatus Omnitrophota bacterium]